MSGSNLTDIPQPLKGIQGYLRLAAEHDQRDPVITYWCRLYSLQTGLKLSTKSNEETAFLLKLMEWLEQKKKALHDNEAITNEVAAQAHIDNIANKLFVYADKQDRASNFGKAVIQSFYSAGLLYDILTLFGELSDEAAQNRKYAKWKAAYIHNCLKNGETPIPGPAIEGDEEDSNENEGLNSGPSTPQVPPRLPSEEQNSNNSGPPTNFTPFDFPPVVQPPQPQPRTNPAPVPTPSNNQPQTTNTTSLGGIELTPEQSIKAQKLIKWAGSALNYDDVPTAVLNLQKALSLLTTGHDLDD